MNGDKNSEFEICYIDNKLLVRCCVCDIKCDTTDQFEIHRKSSRHIKKAETLKFLNADITPRIAQQMSLPSIGVSLMLPYACKICCVDCNTKEQLEVHFQGKNHKKKSLRYEYKDWKSAEIPVVHSSSSSSSHGDEIPLVEVQMASMSHLTDEKIYTLCTNEPPSTIHELSPELADLLVPERSLNFIKCKLCNQSMDTQDQYIMHCNASKHTRKMKNMNIPDSSVTTDFKDMKIGYNDFIHCVVCDISINSHNMESHQKGKIHKEKLIKKTHTICDFQNILKKSFLSFECHNLVDLKLTPRQYQREVYEKSLKNDCVVFLPTGTGKTLVACMIILKMLEENPHHRVAFLVDKVLLVIQQHDFFKNQFENISLTRFDTDGSKTNRKLRIIGLANSYVNTENTFCVRDHDIVVATAELFRGLLSNQKLFWEEFGLVVFDEAHHCVKDHPYNKVLREYQLYPEHVLIDKTDIHTQFLSGIPKTDEKKLSQWMHRRPKIVGLTASPAGDLDKEMTYKLLVQLLEAMGGVDIVNVTENKPELETFTSNSNIETLLLEYSPEEADFRQILASTFFFMLGKFERFITMGKGLTVTRDCRTLTVEDVSDFKSQLKARFQETENIEKSTINHVMSILDIIDSLDTFGYKHAWYQLKDLLENPNEKVWLSDNTIKFVPQTEEIVKKCSVENSSVIQAIIDEAKKASSDSRTVLVLIREREIARQFEAILRKECTGQKLTLLVGHGAGAGRGPKKGMKVAEQKKALDFIRQSQNQIIVATSVADEGIDLPDCDLVILINPPSSVQVLVQVRGRARKKSSRLLMICRDQRSIDELHILQKKEENIIESIEQILAARAAL